MAGDLATTPTHGLDGPALRRRPPLELRRLRQPGAAPRLRPQRLRRDVSRALGVGRQAPCGELRGGLAGERLPGRDRPRDGPGRRLRVPALDPDATRGCAPSRSGMRRSRSSRSSSGSSARGSGPDLLSDVDTARRRDHLSALGQAVDRRHPAAAGSSATGRRCSSDSPTTTRAAAVLPHLYRSYLRSLAPDRRILVEKHRLLDVALKVVGVGSVGTRCYIALFAGPAGGPLVLQVKEARESVLAPYVRGRRPGTRASAWSRASGSCRRCRTASSAGRSRRRPGPSTTSASSTT